MSTVRQTVPQRDDAPGVGWVLEMAWALRDAHARPGRSIPVVAFAGEEELLGSRALAGRPTVGRFSAFLTAYVMAMADAAERPRRLPTSAFAP